MTLDAIEMLTKAVTKLARAASAGTGVAFDPNEVAVIAAWVAELAPDRIDAPPPRYGTTLSAVPWIAM